MKPDRDFRARRHQYLLDEPESRFFARQASPRRDRHRQRELILEGVASGMVRSRRSGVPRAGGWIRQWDRLQCVQDQAAGFAAINLFVGIATKLLQSVRQYAHAAAAALPIAGFGEAGAMMPLCDARVEFAQIVGNRSEGALVFSKQGFEQFLFLALQGLNLFFLFGDRGFVFLEIRFRMLDETFGFFA